MVAESRARECRVSYTSFDDEISCSDLSLNYNMIASPSITCSAANDEFLPAETKFVKRVGGGG